MAQNPNLNIADKFGRTALHLACTSGNQAAVEALINLDEVQIDAQSIGGETPLMKAATQGHRDIVQALLAKNANPNLKSNLGHSARDYAMINHPGSDIASLLP